MRVRIDPHLLARNTSRALDYYAEGRHIPLTVSKFVGLFAPFDGPALEPHLVVCRDGIVRVRRLSNTAQKAVDIGRSRVPKNS